MTAPSPQLDRTMMISAHTSHHICLMKSLLLSDTDRRRNWAKNQMHPLIETIEEKATTTIKQAFTIW
eukprot:NODE_8322_length_1504_cov_16.496732.p6 GENE.NODE_8322_length_1504_cov_16.496732~~NODE_8322_length_1504_cov_16.496732.p6  ORF type:complete len:67 (+),score=8.45 NODE_8322_length_1504_cov_16.496732:1237-1437(+)